MTDGRLQRALELAYRALATRDRTEAELRAYLERKRLPAAIVDEVTGEAAAVGLLDDARYASRFAEDRRRLDH